MSQRTDGAVSAIESLLSFGRVATSEDESQIKEIKESAFGTFCDFLRPFKSTFSTFFFFPLPPRPTPGVLAW